MPHHAGNTFSRSFAAWRESRAVEHEQGTKITLSERQLLRAVERDMLEYKAGAWQARGRAWPTSTVNRLVATGWIGPAGLTPAGKAVLAAPLRNTHYENSMAWNQRRRQGQRA